MNNNGLSVCLSVAMLSEGVHGIDGVILLRDTISPNLYYQQIGRCFSVDMNKVPIIFDLVANCESIMECNLKNDLLDAIEKRDMEDEISNKSNYSRDNKKIITKEEIERFFVFDQVLDAINTFKSIEEHLEKSSNHDDYWGKDKEILIKYFPQMGLDVNKMFSKKRSYQSIISKAYHLGLLQNEWTDEKIEILKENYCLYGASGTKKRFFSEMNIRKIKKKADELGLVYKGNRWKKESIIFLIENYGKMSKHELAKRLNKTENSISKMAYILNLKAI